MKSSDLKQRLTIVYVLAVVTVVVLIVVGVVIKNNTDDDDSPSVGQKAGGGGDGDDGSQPPLKTVAVKRAEGKNATVSTASPSLEKPKQIYLRVSAAPKQEVVGSYNVSCGKGNVAMDTFTVTPPKLVQLELPGKTESCIVGSFARIKGSGRVKLTILRDR